MPLPIEFIFQDIEPPPPELEGIIGQTRFSEVRRQRQLLIDALRHEAMVGGCRQFHYLRHQKERDALITRVENRSADEVCYLRLPSCLGPLELPRLRETIDKARYVMETTLIGPVFQDEAAAVLLRDDALAVLKAPSSQDRRAVFLRLANQTGTMLDHLALVDLRSPRELLRFFTGSTEARYFNSLTIRDGVLTKSSADKEKMRREYSYFHTVPEDMKRFLLPTFGYEDNNGQASYCMEHLVVPDVSLQLIHNALTNDSYHKLIDSFFAFIASRSRREVGRDAVLETGRKQIIDKMTDRLNQFLATPTGQKLDAILMASGPSGGLRNMEARSRILIGEALESGTETELSVSHGDPCFSNILFDRRTGLFRLIDPRGAETVTEAEMHPLYDIAKFSHSILGGYDFVNSDLFDAKYDVGLNLQLVIEHNGIPTEVQQAFKERLQQVGTSIKHVRAVELSLFLSMLPLHADHPRKVLGYALIACQLIDALERTTKNRVTRRPTHSSQSLLENMNEHNT